MLKVLIADDEIKVSKLIQCLVQWDELGMEVIGTVNDGVKAYEMILEAAGYRDHGYQDAGHGWD